MAKLSTGLDYGGLMLLGGLAVRLTVKSVHLVIVP